MKKSLAVLSALSGALLSTTLAAQETIPFLSKAPALDGKVEAQEWQGAKKFTLVNAADAKVAPKEATEVFVARDEKMLYVGFICKESNPDSIRAQWRTPEERDNEIWRDDSVEVHINPFNTGLMDDTRQFIVNSNGIAMDALNDSASAFTCSMESAGMRFADHWGVEMAIPLEEVAYRPDAATIWSMNFARAKTAPAEYSVLRNPDSNVTRLTDASHFEEFLLTPKSGESPIVLRKVTGKPQLFQFEIAKNAPEDAVLTATPLSLDGALSGDKVTITSAPGGAPKFSVKMNPGTDRINFQFKSGDRTLYSLNFKCEKQDTPKSTRTHLTENPLYRELWSDEPVGLAKNGAMFWMHAGLSDVVRSTTLQYGIPWITEETYKEFADSKLNVITQSGTLEGTDRGLLPKSKAAGFRWIFSPNSRAEIGEDVPKYNSFPFLFDPRTQEAYFKDMEKVRKYPDQIFAVFFGDEQVNYAMSSFIEFLEKNPDYTLIKEMDKEIREKYGYGKFGAPQSKGDDNPYRWIAIRKYMNDKMIDFMKRVTKRAREINPDFVVISDDPMATQNVTYDYTEFTPEVCDIVTQQLYPRQNPDRSDFCFLTKYIADLSQVPEIWPCMHVEEYACSYDTNEVIEKISEAVRGGATGIHYYLADTVGRRSGKRYLHSELMGAPERWQVEMALVHEMAKMNKLKFPEADCAIFACLETLRSYPGAGANPVKAATIHSLLELQPKVFFRYVNESSLLKKLADTGKFKVMFVPDAKYIDYPALKELQKYVEQGGTLIVTDPEAFSYAPNANELTQYRQQLLGIKSAKKVENKSSFTYNNVKCPVGKGNTWELVPVKGAKVIGKYNDDTCAVISYQLGKGKVITFGIELGVEENTKKAEYKELFTLLAKENDLKCNQDIWRFRFPDTLIKPLPMPQGRCLTGNAVRWQKFRPLTGWNETLENASYSYSLAPTAPKETQALEKYTLPEGHLTNRLAAIAKGNVDCQKSQLTEWIVGWQTMKPFTITFDLGAEKALDRVEIFYNNDMRDLEIAWSGNGKNYKSVKAPLGKDNQLGNRLDVRVKQVKLPANSKGRFVQFRFAAPKSAEAQTIQISEIEIWGPEA